MSGRHLPGLVALALAVIVVGRASAQTAPVHSAKDRWKSHLSGVVLFGPDRMVPPGAGGPEAPIGSNVQASRDGGSDAQNETSITVNPSNPLNLIGGWNDYRTGDAKAGCAYSFDGGATWTDFGTINEPTFGAQGDPSLAFDLHGNAYYAFISFNRGDDHNGLFVARSQDGGQTFPQVRGVQVHTTSGQPFEDKDYIVCDNTGGARDGNVYVAWARFGNADIVLSRSTDLGQTWSLPVGVSDVGGNEGAIPRVAPDGTIYVAWLDENGSRIEFDKSTNGGTSFGADHTAATVTGLIDFIGSFRANSFPAMDIDGSSGPHSGNVYITWADERNGDADVFFTRSTNGGTTWSAALRINDDSLHNGKDQFFPWIAVDQTTGVIYLSFYDRRDDAGNLLIRTYIARSADGGVTWEANRRVSDASWNPNNDGFGGAFIGDYTGIAADSGRAHPLWTDARNGNADIFTAQFDTRDPIVSDIEPKGGPLAGGTTVTITGQRLYQGFTATFDGVPGTNPIYVSDAQVTVKTPARATGGPVDVKFDNGFGTDTISNGFAYVGLAMSGTPSLGNRVTFTVMGSASSDYVTLLDHKVGSGSLYGITWGLKLTPVYRALHDSIGRGDPPTDGSGTKSDSFTIPNRASLVGVTAFAQSAVDTNGATAGGLVLSNIVTFTVMP